MNPGEREEFDKLVAELCAGYNVPLGERPTAYWKGLAKMSLGQFARVVEEALGEGGPEKIPSTHVIWDMHKKRRVYAPLRIVDDGPKWGGDVWDDRSNKRFMSYLWRTCKAAAELYGLGEFRGHEIGVVPTPKRIARMKILLRGKTAWCHEMRHCKPEEITQEYADILFAELMESHEQQAAREILGDQALTIVPEKSSARAA